MKDYVRYYDKKGKPITDVLAWSKLMEDREYKTVKQEYLPDGKWVSTVWLGLNHNFGVGKPLIFETMVFSKKDDWNDQDEERYSTLEEALAGHKKMVKKWKDKDRKRLK